MAKLYTASECRGGEEGPYLLSTPTDAKVGDVLSPPASMGLSVSEASKLLWGDSDGQRLRQRETPKRVLSIHKLSNGLKSKTSPKKSPLQKLKTVNFKSPLPAKQARKKTSVDKENAGPVSETDSNQNQRKKQFTPIPSRVLTSRDTLSTLVDSNISPKSKEAIIMDNPATRAAYLSRQSPTARKQVKMYGTPQLAGRLGVDRFPDAPKQIASLWNPPSEKANTPARKSLGKGYTEDECQKPQSALVSSSSEEESFPVIAVESIDDHTNQTLALTQTVSTETDHKEESELKLMFSLTQVEESAELPHGDSLNDVESSQSTSDHMYDYFNTGHLASFCETSGEEDESVDSVLKARRAAVSEYNCDALLTGSYDSSKFVDLDAYCEEKENLKSDNDPPDTMKDTTITIPTVVEANESIALSKEVALVNNDDQPGAKPYAVPPEKARCGSCIIL